jgi:transcriptional regulator with XRE-family HTH domain
MGRAGIALKRVLDSYGISQNQLATRMGIDRSNVSRWVSGSRDPSAEAVADIRIALASMKPEAGEEFVQVYLYEVHPQVEIQPITELNAAIETPSYGLGETRSRELMI